MFFSFLAFVSRFEKKDVSTVVGAPWRCVVLTTHSGIAGIGLGHLLGEKSMIQLPRVGWRLLASLNGASPDWIVVVRVDCRLSFVVCRLL